MQFAKAASDFNDRLLSVGITTVRSTANDNTFLYNTRYQLGNDSIVANQHIWLCVS